MISGDLLFSYWIFIWYILYKLYIIPFNPVYIFVISTLFVIIVILSILLQYDNTCNNYKNLLLFILTTFCTKILPIIDMYQNQYGLNDFVFGIVIFIIYNIYLYLRGKTFASIYLNIIVEIREGRLFFIQIIKKTFGI